MFNWFRSLPICPVSSQEKEWIEKRFSWLVNEFGCQRLRDNPLILPTIDFFPSQYEGTEDEIEEILKRVAKYMGLSPDTLRLKFYYDHRQPIEGMGYSQTMGLYEENDGVYDIWLEVTHIADPLCVVSTLAHEVGHVILLGQNRISAEEEDHEDLTDLLTVFLGIGIFRANDAFHDETFDYGTYHTSSMRTHGYLSMDMYGYAFSLYAIARGELSPSWLSHLRSDVRAACKRGIRYITQTGDCQLEHIPGLSLKGKNSYD